MAWMPITSGVWGAPAGGTATMQQPMSAPVMPASSARPIFNPGPGGVLPLPPSTVISAPPGAEPVIGNLWPTSGHGPAPDWLRRLFRPGGRPAGAR